MSYLRRLQISNFKTIKNMDLELGQRNILVGRNGSGKEALLEFFGMLNAVGEYRLRMYAPPGSNNLESLFRDDSTNAKEIEARLELDTEGSPENYSINFFRETNGRLAYSENFSGGSSVVNFSQSCVVFHFNNVSQIHNYTYIGGHRRFLPDGSNLAEVLYRLKRRFEEKTTEYDHCDRIAKTVRLILPTFDDFVLQPRDDEIRLDWKEIGSDQVLGPYDFSDGTLRAICLITLALLPKDEQPDFIIIDEPELGLDYLALTIISAMIHVVSISHQVLVSTQSSEFLDRFEPEDVIVVTREKGETTFTRPDQKRLETWLEDNSLGELWERNLLW